LILRGDYCRKIFREDKLKKILHSNFQIASSPHTHIRVDTPSIRKSEFFAPKSANVRIWRSPLFLRLLTYFMDTPWMNAT